MKKGLFILSIISVVFLSQTQAQIRKGATLLGGDLGVNLQKITYGELTTSKQQRFSAGFAFGKAIRENLVLGGSVSWSQRKDRNLDFNPNYELTNWTAGIFLRKYQPLGKSGFSLFAQGGLNGYHDSEKNVSTIEEIRSTTWGGTLSAYPGLSFAVSKKFQIEMGLNNLVEFGYGVNKRISTDSGFEEIKTSGFNFSASIDNLSGLYLGFRVLLN